MRVIKRYANRRLYDTKTSRYIKLDEVKALVLQREKIKVIDNQTQEDITTYILLQIISDLESKQMPIFTTQMLENMIHFYGNPMQQTMSQFLEQCFSQFAASKGKETDPKQAPLDLMTAFTQQQVELWQSAFAAYMHPEKSKK